MVPIPQVIEAKAQTIPALGFLLPYLNNKAASGINAIKLKSPIIVENIQRNDKEKVTTFLLTFG